jgi:hypothetical protein
MHHAWMAAECVHHMQHCKPQWMTPKAHAANHQQKTGPWHALDNPICTVQPFTRQGEMHPLRELKVAQQHSNTALIAAQHPSMLLLCAEQTTGQPMHMSASAFTAVPTYQPASRQ